MPSKDTARQSWKHNIPKFKPTDMVNVFNFEADSINLAPSECFSYADCKNCPGHKGSSCTISGPHVSKDDILTVIDCRDGSEDMFQLALLMTPTGVLGSFDSEMLDFVPEMIPEEEKTK
jgi:hypothetical protein